MTRERMRNVDATWLSMEHPTNLMMITGVLVFSDPIAVETLKKVFVERISRFDRFRQRVSGRTNPEWVEDRLFDVDSHVQAVRLPNRGDKADLQDFVSNVMSMPLDFTKPLWHLFLVEDYDGGSALIVRIHHAIADGIALVHVLLSITDELFDERRNGVHAVNLDGDRSTGGLSGVARSIGENLNPRRLISTIGSGVDALTVLARLAVQGPDTPTVLKGTLGVAKRAAWTAPVSLESVKAVGKDHGATINDVLMAAVAGGLRRFLLPVHDDIDSANVRMVIPVNLRPLERAHEMGNHFGLVMLDLPVDVKDPLERLERVKRRMDRIKDSTEAGVFFGLLGVAGAAPEQIRKALVRSLSSSVTGVLTNVPGPREHLHLAGSRISRLMFWVPRAGTVGLGVSVLSYAGDAMIGVATDKNLVDDPGRLAEAISEELGELSAKT